MAVSKTRRSFGAAVAFVGVGAAGLMMAGPANAAVTGVDITSASGYGSVAGTYGAGCSYDVKVSVNNEASDMKVYFRVLGPDGEVVEDTATSKYPTGNSASFSWAPGAPGDYTLQATQDAEGDMPDWESEEVEEATPTAGQAISIPSDPPFGSVPFAGACFVLVP
ncbi:hypothetical protein GIY30_07790 [Gordonia sp. HNM0687]|uniref:Secreted protein n=1 Tax=Gordonia mangrovi TaxID=2665643 RepID=A0A6L7GMT8_9ACTN|nr:hypothetical protein [Gordonia mangrovi]MXP21254.1 hypothetical protein [Gordonia mangrovi]UVF78219.1 hypothetical protein NWF22_23900 [Gordonia mangrovi]